MNAIEHYRRNEENMAITLVIYAVNEQIHTFKQNRMSLLLISIGLHAKTWTATFHSMPFITATKLESELNWESPVSSTSFPYYSFYWKLQFVRTI